MIKKILLILFSIIATLENLNAQGANNSSWLENTMYSSGKINVVIVVLSISFIGITIFLFLIERKLKRAEKNNK